MASENALRSLLRALTHYVQTASVGASKDFDTSNKWFVVNPSSPPVDAELHSAFAKADSMRIKRGNQKEHTIGALTVILDMSTGNGWDGTPTTSVHVEAKKDTIVVGTRDKKPYWWRYPSDEFNTFVVIVPKKATAAAQRKSR